MNKKEIYFCVDYSTAYCMMCNTQIPFVQDYISTNMALAQKWDCFITTSIAHLSFDLLDCGYDIYLCYKDKKVKIEPHMDLYGTGEPCKDIRRTHNIFKMFRGGIFNELLGIKQQ